MPRSDAGELLVAKRLVFARELKGWTQEQLAQEAGLSAGTISDYERAVRSPGVVNLKLIAKALGTSVDELLREPADEPTIDARALIAALKAATRIIESIPPGASGAEVQQKAITTLEMVRHQALV